MGLIKIQLVDCFFVVVEVACYCNNKQKKCHLRVQESWAHRKKFNSFLLVVLRVTFELGDACERFCFAISYKKLKEVSEIKDFGVDCFYLWTESLIKS